MTMAQVRKLVRESEKAAQTVVRNRRLIETYLSILDYKAGRVQTFRSGREMFRAAKRA